MKKTLCLLLCLLICIVSCGITVAWLGAVLGVARFPTEFTGSANAAYFAGGNGSEEKPYEISNAVHLYNLAWLQYLGYFNMNPDMNNGLAQSYFKLTADIDMGRLKSAIPPIGTTQYPFIGHFDGGNFTIRSLTVSNAKGDTAKTLKVRPSNAEFQNSNNTETDLLHTTDKASEIEIVGLFGVTGNYNGYTDGYAEDNADFVKEEMSVSGFYADKLHVNSNTAQTLVGLVGGYIGSNFANVGVYRGDISLVSGVTGIAALSGGASVVSKYSLVGAYDESLVTWSGLPQGKGWGGTIDMRTINRRLTYMYAQGEKTMSASDGEISTSTVFNTNLMAAVRDYGDYEYSWQKVNGYISTMWLSEGTILPINVDKEKMGIATWDADNEQEIEYNGITYHTNNIYATNTGEIIANNTGYIVGDKDGIRATVRAGIRKLIGSSYDYYKGIPYSFAGQSLADTASVYNPKSFAMYTVQNGVTYRIIDSVNQENENNYSAGKTVTNISADSFQRYQTVRDEIDTMLAGATIYHGFHFDNYGPSIYAVKTYGNVTEAYYTDPDNDPEGKGNQYVKGGLNFNVAQKGRITAVLAGGYGNGTHTMFDLYQVTKQDGKITGIKRIDKIYVDAEENVYYDDEQRPADATEVISIVDLSSSNSLMEKAAFYFEIPVKSGDYFISYDASNVYSYDENGNYTGSSSYKDNAYLMYLDIGANGTEGGGSGEKPYTMETVDFVNTDTIVLDANNAYPAYKAVVMSLADVAASGTPYILYERATGTEVEDGKIATKLLYKYEGIGTLTVLPDGMAETGNLTDYRDEVAGSG